MLFVLYSSSVMIIAIIVLSVLLVGAATLTILSFTEASRVKARCAALDERVKVTEDQLTSLRNYNTELEQSRFDALENLHKKSEENARKSEKIASLEADVQRLTNQISGMKSDSEADNEEKRQQFELLARRILDSQASTLRENNNREISALLSPLKSDIERFKTRVEECYSNEARERFSLNEKIKDLIEANQSIGKQAEELSTALRGNSKIQGDWGEMVLESILEKSGLRKGEEFEIQATTDNTGRILRDNEGHLLRPDVIIRYPDNRFVVIDSKVSLTAFTEYVNADDVDSRDLYLKQHLASVMKHISELSDKHYQEYVGNGAKLDFVIMFVPNEGAFSAAVHADPGIWQKAYDKNVIFVSPTLLMGALRLVAQMWRHDRQTRNAIEIASQSGKMYDKFASFVEDLIKVEKGVQSTSSALTEAFKKLRDGRGNLLSRAEKLKNLGVKTSKQIALSAESDDIDDTTETTLIDD